MVVFVPGFGVRIVLDDDNADAAIAELAELVEAQFAAWLARILWLAGPVVFEPAVPADGDDTPAPVLPLEVLTDRPANGPPVASVVRVPAGVNRAA